MDKIKPFQYWVQKTLPAVYDDSLSYYQLLAKIVHHLNTIGNSQNEVIDELRNTQNEVAKKVNELMKWFDNLDVQDEINAKLDKMAEDGTLDQIINHNIFNELNEQLAQIMINPDDYEGSDYEKVQQAIDNAIKEQKAIRFSRLFDITGHTLKINKPTNERIILYLNGFGGGIEKHDEGFIFDTDQDYTGDVTSSNMKYISTSGANTTVWNGEGQGGIIRITSTNDTYRNVDHVLTANESYAQTARFIACTITGGKGWAFEWKKSFDTTIADCTIEHRQHGIRNTYFSGNPDNNTLRIINNVIEGLTGDAMDLGSSFGVTITGNYFENNQGSYIDLSKTENYHNGLTITGNTFQQSTQQIAEDVPAIKLGRLGNQGVLSSGNTSTGVLYELFGAGTPGVVVSIGDISYNNKKAIGHPELLKTLGRVTRTQDDINYGNINIIHKTVETEPVGSGESIVVNVDFSDKIVLDISDIISYPNVLATGNRQYTVDHVSVDRTNHIVIVKITNHSPTSQSFVVRQNVLKISQ